MLFLATGYLSSILHSAASTCLRASTVVSCTAACYSDATAASLPKTSIGCSWEAEMRHVPGLTGLTLKSRAAHDLLFTSETWLGEDNSSLTISAAETTTVLL